MARKLKWLERTHQIVDSFYDHEAMFNSFVPKKREYKKLVPKIVEELNRIGRHDGHNLVTPTYQYTGIGLRLSKSHHNTATLGIQCHNENGRLIVTVPFFQGAKGSKSHEGISAGLDAIELAARAAGFSEMRLFRPEYATNFKDPVINLTKKEMRKHILPRWHRNEGWGFAMEHFIDAQEAQQRLEQNQKQMKNLYFTAAKKHGFSKVKGKYYLAKEL